MVVYAVLFVLPAGLFTLMQSNLVQTYLAKKVSAYLSEKLNTEVTVDKVEIRFFADVVLKKVYIEDLHDNPLLSAEKINVQPGHIDLSSNYFGLKKVVLENTFFNLRKYKDEKKLNLQFLMDFFKTDKKKTARPKYPVKVVVDKLKLSGSGFSYIDDNKEHNNNGVMDFDDINISSLDVDMKNVAVLGDSVCAEIKNLSLHEKCGFIIREFSANSIVSKRNIVVNNLLAKTNNSNLNLDLTFAYEDFKSFKDFVHKVVIISAIRPTDLNFIDIAYFVRQLHGMNDLIHFSSQVKGTVSNLKVKKFMMHYGADTYFDGDIAMNGLPKIDETFINLKVRDLTSSVSDLNTIVIPSANGEVINLKLPLMLQRLGNINVNGVFTGFYTNFVSNATLNSDLGTISTDIIVRNENKVISYEGEVSTENFYLGQLLDAGGLLGKVSLVAQLGGSGLTAKDADLIFQGNIDQLEFKGYNYSGISVNGSFVHKIFNGVIEVEDKNLEMVFNGEVDINDSLPDFDFEANVTYANLKMLKINPKDTVSEVKGRMNIDFYGNNIDNLKGYIAINDASFHQNHKYFDLRSFNLNTYISPTGYRTFDLKSDYVDAVFNGYFVFSELGNSFKNFLLNYLPNVYFALDTNNKNLARQEFNFDIRLYNATPVLDYLVDGLEASGNTMVKGNFNSLTNHAKIEAVSSKLSYKSFSLENWSLDFAATEGRINLHMNSDTLHMSDSSYLSNVNLDSRVLNDSISSSLQWDNKKATKRNAGNLNFYNYFYTNTQSVMGFKPSKLVVNDSVWTISPQGKIVFDTGSIACNNLMLWYKEQNLAINGKISKNPSDVLAVEFNSFDISNVDYLSNAKKFDLDGIINGNVFISDIYNAPTYFADLKIKDFGINYDKLGDASIQSKWDDVKKGVHIKAEIYYIGNIGKSTPVIAEGYYYPGDKPQNFDIDISVENLRLKALSRYVASFGSIVSGTATGKLYLRGKRNPELSGLLKVMRGALKINYLNTVYAFAFDSVKITKDEFLFQNLIAFDQPDLVHREVDTVLVSGSVTHENFKNLGFNINVEPKKALVLNTSASMNDLFYGKGYATGNARIYGTQNIINFDISATTEKGTQLIIPVGNTSALQASEYITFITQGHHEDTISEEKGKAIKGINLDMSFNVTDDAEVQLLFDPRVGDRILGRGNGNIRITIADNQMNMFGDYVLTSGDYLFTFQNIINKRFLIDPGSTVKWNGDPYNAELDIRARYTLRANLAGLGVDTNTRYVNVDCIINMSNVLSNPEFSFEVDIPSMQDYEKVPYLAAINQNINNNFISLLVINSFVNPNTGIGSATSAGVSLLGKSASEVLSNQLSNWLSQISKNVNIGINYRPGDNISQEEVAVALSTQLFNDRVTVSSNLGVATGQTATGENKNSNQIVGDVDIEVKISRALKLKVYNHTNQYSILQYTAPYTQGIGIVYRKEFNTYRDLFLKNKNKKK